MTNTIFAVCLAALLLCASGAVYSQSGGQYEIKGSVIAGGGGQASGGNVSNITIVGQSTTGKSAAGGVYTATGGFFLNNIIPPPSIVTVSGRVLTANGRAIRRARVMLVYPNGSKQTAQNSTQNGFVFDNVAGGQTYTIIVATSRFTFPPLVMTINDNISGLDLIANP